MKKNLPYSIYFFLPDDMHYRMAEFSTESPPPTFQTGDLVDARSWDRRNLGNHGAYFRVRSIEHQIIPSVDDENEVGCFQIGIHLEELSKEDYFQVAVGRPPGGAE